MKLLFVHERFGAFGGAETNLSGVAFALKNRGHTLGLIHGPSTGQSDEAWRRTFASCFALSPKGGAALVHHAVEEFQPDLIYVHKMPDLEVIEALVDSPVPVVRMVHDHDLYCMRSYKYNVLNRAICTRAASPFCVYGCGASLARQRGAGFPIRWISYSAKKKELRLNQRFHRMIVATRYMKQELVQNGFDELKIQIHAPVPQTPKTQLVSTFSERNVIVYVGQVIRGKGVDVLLESLVQIKVPFQCLIVGDGNHRSFCEKLSRRLKLEDRVQFLGFIPHEQIQDYFGQASVVVMSSVWPEPFGAAGLEGMRYGLPVVAFDAGGIREWLISGYNGFLAPWMDRAAFAARVEELLVNKTLGRQLGERGARLMAQRFDFSDYISGLEQSFLEVISEAREKVNA